MSFRTIVISKQSKLDYKLGQMVVRNETVMKINISEIAVLIIENTNVSLTAYLLSELTKRKVKVIFCDEKRHPQYEIIPYYGSHDTSVKIKMQIGWDDLTKLLVHTEIVREKITKQINILNKLKSPQVTILEEYLTQIEVGDKTNREGHAAKVYFNTIFGQSFSRSLDIPTNAALNYGYSILLSMFNREIVSMGYMTQIGVFHSNMFNQFNLSSDLMEPFRPIIDELVISLNIEKFETEEKHQMLTFLNKQVYIDNQNQYITNAIKIYCRSVFEALNQNDISLIRFYGNEL